MMLRRSTKRAIRVFGVLFILAVLIWGVRVLTAPSPPASELLSLLPETAGGRKAAAAVGARDLRSLYRSLRGTGFLEALKGSAGYLQENDAPDPRKILRVLGRPAAAAFYGGGRGRTDILLVSAVNDPSGILRLLYGKTESAGENGEYLGVPVKSLSERWYYAVKENTLFVSTGREMVKAALELASGQGGSIDAVYPVIARNLDPSADGFIFALHKRLGDLADIPLIKNSASDYSFHDIYSDRGLYIKSFTPDETPAPSGRFRAEAAGLIPERPVLAGISSGVDIREQYTRVTGEYLPSVISGALGIKPPSPDDKPEEIFKYFGTQFGYAILGPSEDNIGHALPVIMVAAEAESRRSLEKLYGFSEKILGVDMETAEYGGVEYRGASFPVLFGQRVEIFSLPLSLRRKHFIVFTTSRSLTEELIDISSGRKRSLASSPAWREVSSYFPSGYSSAGYADINALAGTVGLFYATIRGDRGLRDLIRAGSFAWAGPAGSATVHINGLRVSHFYLPVQDLSLEKWQEIFSALEKIIS